MRGVKKENLPTKICTTCGRPFNWRKKWERVWDEVTTCSKSCNRKRREANRQTNQSARKDEDLQEESAHNDGRLASTSLAAADGSQNDAEIVQVASNLQATSLSITQSPNDTTTATSDGDDVDESTSTNLLEEIANEMSAIGDEEAESPSEKENDSDEELDPVALKKAQRKAAKKAKKAERRAQREGRGSPTAGQKTCDMCDKSVNLLVRCMYEKGQTDWKMVCGKCWHVASGGVVDGDATHPHYRYGGLWKNRRKQG